MIVVAIVLALSACTDSRESQPVRAPADHPPVVGGDRDAHGCIPSAGYSWCARTAQCERPWELAKREGFSPSAQAFDAFCEGSGH